MLRDLFNKRRHYATLGKTVEREKVPTPDPVEKDIPKGLVEKCDACGNLIMGKELQKHAYTCPECNFHFRVDAYTRIALTLDEGSFVELNGNVTSTNPLGFPDYESKLEKAQKSTGLTEGAVTGEGTIDGVPVAIAVMDPRFIMGSMGSAVGEKLTRIMERATEEREPLILFTASGGARMQEGILSLMQMAKTSVALRRMHDEQVLFVTVITHPTTGGVSASFASLGDIIFAEPGAMFGFAGKRVIEQTIRQKLPDDFQTAEFNLKHGMVDKVVHRKQLRDALGVLVRIHSARGWADAE
ncbi:MULTISPECIES: acetyl-CoA carboxylase, carboxyltransferase subunit beta [Alicyclobacillus]|uniref:Acetyl-coenzyme A carboxylase carboxyl transferase subunit beta n=1 Tax=Alicyclobacillus acidoterrestris (strain ATCC 49025 / DSM 3922 / CIP 106132 / NCIMB 13137 / GD3B) TaxID=1356854 RepID=T0C4J9_ALIAG|nr:MULTISPECIES: acetyl-CoA carboxylase, carboxyltransferase subunit beta [Alicyclobacillus]EPZ47470.1 acetyl-CoA carboxylase subunit beta [Alicyclobacillus acidoterrestris ATCC 49025]UNO48560.1 acetyl-CoA carboxylase, carboxyltransferase subunit beta [Alicyclobacillus acidoterrestris]